MSNWTAIARDDLKAAANGNVVDRAGAAAVGGVDPVAEETANAVARIRRACQRGNILDVDPTKIPKSLKAVTVRLVIWALMERIRLPLTDDQKDTRRNDNSDIIRLSDGKERVESPDNPSGDAEMQGVASPDIQRRRNEFNSRAVNEI